MNTQTPDSPHDRFFRTIFSRPERWTLLQLLGYMVEIWKRHRRDNPAARELPVIVPLIFSHSHRR